MNVGGFYFNEAPALLVDPNANKPTFVRVRARRIERDLAKRGNILWERHPDHPGGEITIRNDGTTYRVALTTRIEAALKTGLLDEVI